MVGPGIAGGGDVGGEGFAESCRRALRRARSAGPAAPLARIACARACAPRGAGPWLATAISGPLSPMSLAEREAALTIALAELPFRPVLEPAVTA